MAARDRIYLYLLEERDRQEKLWGVQHHGRFEWSTILGEEFGEVCQASNDGDMRGLKCELIEVMAVAMAWIEDLEGALSEGSGALGFHRDATLKEPDTGSVALPSESDNGEWSWVGRS